MSARRFKFRFNGEYTGEENDIKELRYEHITDSGWRPYDPENYTAGFLIFLYALFNCQHMYFRMRCAERGINLRKVSGELDAEANEDWTLSKLDVRIDGELIAGEPGAEDVDYIIECMQHCPASVNLNFPHGRTRISFS